MKETLTVEMTKDELWFMVDGFWNTYGCAEPDPRTSDHADYIRSGPYTKEEANERIRRLKVTWDERYASHFKWAKRLRRLERKEVKCFGTYDESNNACLGCLDDYNCSQLTDIIKAKGHCP